MELSLFSLYWFPSLGVYRFLKSICCCIPSLSESLVTYYHNLSYSASNLFSSHYTYHSVTQMIHCLCKEKWSSPMCRPKGGFSQKVTYTPPPPSCSSLPELMPPHPNVALPAPTNSPTSMPNDHDKPSHTLHPTW